jgi:tetratricopeptide (TPR) repeat protein
MTNNHLLLYRLAELMLLHEQQLLPVDLLFDDEQIADFAKSIQIDSPYQQMLLEGVLTESVRDEKLYVSFTVEGYFHYLLGEVIYNQTEGLGAEALKQIIEKNKLNGAMEGVEQCLIRDVQKGDLTRLIWMIDIGGKHLEVCVVPLSYAFLQSEKKIDSEKNTDIDYTEQVNRVLNELFNLPSTNDFNVLELTITHLDGIQKYDHISSIYKRFNEIIEPNNLSEANAYIKSINYIQYKQRREKLDQLIDKTQRLEKNEELAYFFYTLAQQFQKIAEHEIAINYYEKGLTIALKIHGNQHQSISACYYSLGDCWSEKSEYDKAIDYYKKSLEIRINSHDNQHITIGETYNNLGLTLIDKGEYDLAIDYLEKSLQIYLKVCGKIHPSTGTIYNNIALALNEKGDCNKAISYHEQVLSIDMMVYGSEHPLTGTTYNNLGSVWNSNEDYDKAINFYEKSLIIALKNEGESHPFTAIVYDNLGTAWCNKNKTKIAKEYYDKAFEIRLKTLGERHVATGKSYNNIGNIFKIELEYQNAFNYYSKAYQIFKDKLGEEHQYTLLLNDKINKLNDL